MPALMSRSGVQDFPAVAEGIGDRTEICLVARYPGKAIGSFDRLFGPGESLLCKERRGQPIARGTDADAVATELPYVMHIHRAQAM